MPSSTQAPPLTAKLAYCVPYMAGQWLWAPMALLQGIYAKYYGLSLTSIAALILIIRLSDVFTDPLIAYYSDRCYQRYGTRKPFVLVGGLLLMLGGYFLYAPTSVITLQPLSTVSAGYFLFWSMVFFLGWTFFDMAHMAWANELSPTSQDKTQLFSMRAAAVYSGIIVFYCVPFLPAFETPDITPEVVRLSATLAIITMMVSLYLCLRWTPARLVSSASYGTQKMAANKATQSLRVSLQQGLVILRSMLDNKPLVIIISALLLKYVGAGMFAGLLFIYVDVYLGLGQYFAQMMIIGFIGSLISIPLWQRLANKFGKRVTWMVAMTLALSGFAYAGLLAPGSSFYRSIIVNVLVSAGAACTWSITMAMYGEVVDYSHWKYRVERTAMYFSLYTLMSKITSSVSISLGLGIAGWYGLDATATRHDEQAIWGLKLAMSGIPVLFTTLTVILIAMCPIDTRRHHIIRRRLDQRAARMVSCTQ